MDKCDVKGEERKRKQGKVKIVHTLFNLFGMAVATVLFKLNKIFILILLFKFYNIILLNS